MDALLAFIFSAFPGAVLGLMLVSCHIRKYGGEETDKLKINSCLIFFGSIPTTLFLYSSFKLLFGKYRSTDISI